MSFLEILGVIFLIIMLVIAYYGFKLVRWFKKVSNSALCNAMNLLPPINFQMYEVKEPEWVNFRRQKEDEEALIKFGFKPVGVFETQHWRTTTQFMIFSNEKKGLCALIYEAKTSVEGQDEEIYGYAMDFFLAFTDGSTLTISNSPFAGNLPRQDSDKMVHVDERDVTLLAKHIKPNVPAGVKVKPIRDPLREFKQFVRQYNSWLWEKEQLQSEEIKKNFEALNINLNDELLDELLEHAQYERTELIQEETLEKLSRSTVLSAAQWEIVREKLVVVHDNMTASQLAGCFYELMDEPHDRDEEIVDDLEEREELGSAISVFEDTLQRLRIKNRVKRVATLKSNPVVHVYADNSVKLSA